MESHRFPSTENRLPNISTWICVGKIGKTAHTRELTKVDSHPLKSEPLSICQITGRKVPDSHSLKNYSQTSLRCLTCICAARNIGEITYTRELTKNDFHPLKTDSRTSYLNLLSGKKIGENIRIDKRHFSSTENRLQYSSPLQIVLQECDDNIW